ncbi:hypothetical protein CONPUDRAFT_71531 [Coniophora puteana RWD-64-598 SS2]|uniref:F-box domain-containing protein n=1 Tax=Coniophora puteana (strain RWD-64-598) TaxID=741705 RepID=A0A5M3MVU7_CONPW|nr:uncharacterized protein CONPUDRAFT_71531 [Coniophora puteana RWD-64-598 SS2]EIW82844.1 hypothetical protein CONPUDRAFT_71531 [Coniophora puteana RWD-64-598 SS2]
MHVDTNLDTLPFDVLQTIATSLEVLDLIHLRQVSKRLRDFTSERVVWTEKYRTSHLPRPPGPLTSHSLLDLEKILVRTAKVHQNMVTKAEPLSIRDTDIGAEEDFRLLAGRWLISRSTDEVHCRDLDNPDFPRSSPIVCIHECSDDYNLSSLDCIEIIGHNGHSHAFIIIIEQRGLEEAWLIVLKLRELTQANELCDEIYRRHFYLLGSSSSVEAAIGPSSLLVKWENVNNVLLIIDINDTQPVSPLEVFDDTTEEVWD